MLLASRHTVVPKDMGVDKRHNGIGQGPLTNLPQGSLCDSRLTQLTVVEQVGTPSKALEGSKLC